MAVTERPFVMGISTLAGRINYTPMVAVPDEPPRYELRTPKQTWVDYFQATLKVVEDSLKRLGKDRDAWKKISVAWDGTPRGSQDAHSERRMKGQLDQSVGRSMPMNQRR